MRAAVLAPLLALLGGLLVAAPASAVTVTITSNLTKVREGSPVEFSGKAPAGSTVQLYQGAHKIPTPSTTASTKVPLPAATTKATSSGTWKIRIVSAERAADGKKYVDGFRNYRVRVGSTQSAARQVNSYRPVSVSLSKTISGKKTAVATNEEIYSRSGITFSAVLSYGVKGNPAYLQRRVATRSSSGKITGTQWATVKTATTGSTGANRTVSFGSVSTPPGRWQYRVSTKLVGLYAIGYSTTPAVHVVSCTTYPSRPAGIQPAFSNPGAYSTADRTKRSKALRDQLVKTICAADTGAELKLAMWHIDDDALYRNPPEMVNPILRALDYVSATRKVKVSMVVDDSTGKQAYTTEWLKQIAARNGGGYYQCKDACLNERELQGDNNLLGDNHQKLMTISKAGGKPVTVVSTSNWSYWQLRDYWNSTTAMWSDDAVYARASGRLNQMIAAASRTSTSQAWPNNSGNDAIRLTTTGTTGLWVPTAANNESAGSNTSGTAKTSISFSPTSGYDPILDRLKSYTCEKDPDTGKVKNPGVVRFAVLLGQSTVGDKWVDTVKDLKSKGCKVYVVMSRPIPSGAHVFGTDKATYDGLKKQLGGSTTYLRCGSYIHTKNILFDQATSRGDTNYSVWTGPRNLDWSGFNISDETTLRIRNDAGVYNKYKADWINIWKKSGSCSGITWPARQ